MPSVAGTSLLWSLSERKGNIPHGSCHKGPKGDKMPPRVVKRARTGIYPEIKTVGEGRRQQEAMERDSEEREGVGRHGKRKTPP